MKTHVWQSFALTFKRKSKSMKQRISSKWIFLQCANRTCHWKSWKVWTVIQSFLGSILTWDSLIRCVEWSVTCEIHSRIPAPYHLMLTFDELLNISPASVMAKSFYPQSFVSDLHSRFGPIDGCALSMIPNRNLKNFTVFSRFPLMLMICDELFGKLH